MNKKTKKKLSLSKLTVSNLNKNEANRIQGGRSIGTDCSELACPPTRGGCGTGFICGVTIDYCTYENWCETGDMGNC